MTLRTCRSCSYPFTPPETREYHTKRKVCGPAPAAH
jgi:hypothetical protein